MLSINQSRITHLEETLAAGGTNRRDKSEKLLDPDKFDGTRAKLDDFLTDIRLKMIGNHDRYPTEGNKINYAITRLEGKAKDQFRLYLIERSTMPIHTVEDVYAILEQAFGNANRKGTV